MSDRRHPAAAAAAQRRAASATRPAIREKDLGIWQPYSWRQYWEEVRDFALGLAAHGFKRGDKLSVIGDNRPRLYFAQLAAQSLGGIAVPVYQDAIATRARLCARSCRGLGGRRRGPGAGRQDPVAARISCRI